MIEDIAELNEATDEYLRRLAAHCAGILGAREGGYAPCTAAAFRRIAARLEGRTAIQTGADILAEVAADYGLSLQAIRGKSRFRNIVEARHEVMWKIRKRTNLSTTQIGRIVRRDHATVIFGIAAHERRLADAWP